MVYLFVIVECNWLICVYVFKFFILELFIFFLNFILVIFGRDSFGLKEIVYILLCIKLVFVIWIKVYVMYYLVRVIR